ncbi:HNH endonuclease [Halorubrum aethiopicum]|uniref:HNH endonuclease n=1 Tax=Halorubrum aethiopicum TaxID=1758255 RepID=UPI000AC8101E|nr:hypothetical protein [Halorubrum aethiopicum]
MNSEPKYRDEEWLREQYVEEHRSTTDISEECGCARSTVSKWLNKHDIETRTGRVSDERLNDADWLRKQYVEERRRSSEIAEDCGCSKPTVVRRLNKHNIEVRTETNTTTDQRLADPEWLREQCVDERRSIYDIANECGCDSSTVSRWLSKHDIEAAQSEQQTPDQRLIDADWLREQYVEEGQSTNEIADDRDCSSWTVSKWLSKHDIEARPGIGELSGEEHPHYNGGPAPYGPGWNYRKRAEVRERDDHTCQDPRCSVTQADHLDEYGKKLHVHHLRKARDVEDPEDRNAKTNLITLCRDCHHHWERISDTGLVPEVER